MLLPPTMELKEMNVNVICPIMPFQQQVDNVILATLYAIQTRLVMSQPKIVVPLISMEKLILKSVLLGDFWPTLLLISRLDGIITVPIKMIL